MRISKPVFNQCLGVNLTLSGSSEPVADCCLVSIRGDQIDIDQQVAPSGFLAEVIKKLPKGTILSLNLCGKGVLNKQFPIDDQENPDEDFSRILPGAAAEDFYIQLFTSGSSKFCSVVKKTEADKFIKTFNEAGFPVIALSLGPFAADSIMPQINAYDTQFVFNGHDIRFNENKHWISFDYQSELKAHFEIKADLITLHERVVLPYAAAFQALLQDKIAPVKANIEVLEGEFKKLVSNARLKRIGFAVIAVFFVALAINTLLFSKWFSENEQLSTQLSRSASDNQDLMQFEDKAAKNESLLAQFGWDNDFSKSMLVDQTAALLPDGVTWTSAEINPVDVFRSRQARSVVFSERRMVFNGSSASVIAVNEWIARIKTLKWIREARLESFTFNNELNTGKYKILLDY